MLLVLACGYGGKIPKGPCHHIVFVGCPSVVGFLGCVCSAVRVCGHTKNQMYLKIGILTEINNNTSPTVDLCLVFPPPLSVCAFQGINLAAILSSVTCIFSCFLLQCLHM